jgi:hypothetical protein
MSKAKKASFWRSARQMATTPGCRAWQRELARLEVDVLVAFGVKALAAAAGATRRFPS